ncbi:hypothetical protein [Nocardia sp. NPDC050175]|uniref:hypothetical protein n=1 Tax=Nocardia sp. NPDC050175 TaxID=3364317 RepID=UPI0037956007
MYQYPPDEFDHQRFDRARRLRIIGIVVGIIVVVLVVGYLVLRNAPSPSHSTARVTPAVDNRAKVDASHPFEHTPAAIWPEGAAGIMPPPAQPVGGHPADQVADIMDKVRQLIITARLDRHVLQTHDPEPVLAQLAAHQVEDIRGRLGDDALTWWVTTKLADRYPLLPALPRVTGSMTPTLNDKGELTIKTNYLVAYAFNVGTTMVDGPMDIMAVDRQEVDYVWVDDPAYDAGSQGMWFGEVKGFVYAANCPLHRRGLLAPSYPTPPRFAPAAPAAPHSEAEYFDPTVPIPQENDC